MPAKPKHDLRLWYRFVFKWDSEDPLGRSVRGLFHRFAKGRWTWMESAAAFQLMYVYVEDRSDAMLLRLYMNDHDFHVPKYSEGFEDHTTDPPSIFRDGKFVDMTKDEIKEAYRQLVEDVDEKDDWVQYCHETKRA